MITNILITIWCIFSMFLDFKYKRISNYLTYSLICIFTVINIIISSYQGLFNSVVGLILGMVVCLIPYKLNACDYGEFKILGLIGVIAGYQLAILTCIVSIIFILLIYILHLIISGKLKSVIFNVDTYFHLIMEYDVDISVILEEHFDTIYIPYSVIVFLSTILLIII